jgi:hypothetical protein
LDVGGFCCFGNIPAVAPQRNHLASLFVIEVGKCVVHEGAEIGVGLIRLRYQE